MQAERLHLPGETARLEHGASDIRLAHRIHIVEAAIVAVAIMIAALAGVAIFAL